MSTLPDCQNCFWMKMRQPDRDGHCYMFRDAPSGDCAKFSTDGAATPVTPAGLLLAMMIVGGQTSHVGM